MDRSVRAGREGHRLVVTVPDPQPRLLDAVISVASEVTLPAMLRRITELAAELSGAQYAALGVVGQDEVIDEFITVGMDDHVRTQIGALPSGKGILGLLIRDPESLRLPDLGRIARDMHDLIIQRLFAIGLGLQGQAPRRCDPQLRAGQCSPGPYPWTCRADPKCLS